MVTGPPSKAHAMQIEDIPIFFMAGVRLARPELASTCRPRSRDVIFTGGEPQHRVRLSVNSAADHKPGVITVAVSRKSDLILRPALYGCDLFHRSGAIG